MRIVLAPDSFKGSLSAVEACKAMHIGVLRAIRGAVVVDVPVADGGEGTTEALVAAIGGRLFDVVVTGPLSVAAGGCPVAAQFGLLGDGGTGVLEMARASGLDLVSMADRNPVVTSTYGTGELIAAALAAGAEKLIVGIGGSATTDGGAGMAQALGARFLDESGRPIDQPMTGGSLERVAGVDLSGILPAGLWREVQVACDVANPLLGPEGAATVYGPQKGASPSDVARLERGMARYIDVVEAAIGRRVRDVPGAGAAGGLGAGLLAFLGAKLTPGIDIVLDACGFSEKLLGADLVLTGEGQIDGQTVNGKTISGVARAAARAGVPVVALAGRVGPGADRLGELGLESVHAIAPTGMPEAEAMARAAELLAHATEKILQGR